MAGSNPLCAYKANVSSSENLTKRSSNTVLRLASFSVEQWLDPLYTTNYRHKYKQKSNCRKNGVKCLELKIEWGQIILWDAVFYILRCISVHFDVFQYSFIYIVIIHRFQNYRMTTSFLKYVSYIPNEVLIKWNLDAKVFNEKAFQAIFWYTWQLFCTFHPPNFWSFCNFGKYVMYSDTFWCLMIVKT